MLLWFLVAATLPVGLFGYIFKAQAETTWRNPNVIAAMMIGVGAILWLAERAGRRQKDLSRLSFADALSIGFAQVLSIVPGTSRSGITIAAGLFRNLDRASAARFSFLLSTPAIAAAAAKDFYDLLKHEGGIPPAMRDRVWHRNSGQRHHRLHRDPLLHELPQKGHAQLLRRVPRDFWHNDNCSGSFLPVHRRMNYLGPTTRPRLNEAVAVVFLFAGLFLLISLVSYNPFDPSWDTASGVAKPVNLTGRLGAFFADLFLQLFGLVAYAIPALILLLGWNWIQSAPIQAPSAKLIGSALMVFASCAALGFGANWRPIADSLPGGGVLGVLLADALIASLNLTGAAMVTAVFWIVGLYLVSKFEVSMLASWFRVPAGWFAGISARWTAWRKSRALMAKERAEQRALRRAMAPKPSVLPLAPSAPQAPPIVDHFEPGSCRTTPGRPVIQPLNRRPDDARIDGRDPDPHAGGTAVRASAVRTHRAGGHA